MDSWTVALFLILGVLLAVIARFGHAIVDAFERAIDLYFQRRTLAVTQRVAAQLPADAGHQSLVELVRAELRRSVWQNAAIGIAIAAIFFVFGLVAERLLP
jgi:hypothetical protein